MTRMSLFVSETTKTREVRETSFDEWVGRCATSLVAQHQAAPGHLPHCRPDQHCTAMVDVGTSKAGKIHLWSRKVKLGGDESGTCQCAGWERTGAQDFQPLRV